MCSVGDSFDIEIEGGMDVHKYECRQCNNTFKGIGANLRCPKCQSKDVKCLD